MVWYENLERKCNFKWFSLNIQWWKCRFLRFFRSGTFLLRLMVISSLQLFLSFFFYLCIHLIRKQKIQKLARNRYRYSLDLWMAVDFVRISFLSQPPMFTPDLAWQTCLRMSRVKTASLNNSFKWDLLCLYWPPDVLLQQANKMQKRSWGEPQSPSQDYRGRQNPTDFHTEGASTRQSLSISFTAFQQTSQIWCRCVNQMQSISTSLLRQL